jgi:hypothetical protein
MHKTFGLTTATIFALFVFMPTTIMAGCFDGQGTMIYSVNNVNECDFGESCETVSLSDIQAPPFLTIDFKTKKISPAGANIGNERRSSSIMQTTVIDKKLILQGAEDGIGKSRDGAGWTMVITQDTGTMMLSVAGEDTVFVASGNCICK